MFPKLRTPLVTVAVARTSVLFSVTLTAGAEADSVGRVGNG